MNQFEHSQLKSILTGSTITIIVVFLLVHGALFGFGLTNDNSLLSGDRSTARNATIAYVFDVEKIGDYKLALNNKHTSDSIPHFGGRVLNSGHAGDYLIQGSILALTNRHMLVLLQLALALISILCFFSLLKHSGFSVSTATVFTLFYLLLPGSLLPAHQLGSEALCIPCIIIACYLLVISSEHDGIDIAFIVGLLTLSVAIFVRPQLVLFPFLLFAIYLFFTGKKLNTLLFTVIPISLLFSAIWLFVVVSNNGHFSLGGQDRSIGRSFHDTTEQMAMSGDFDFNTNAYTSRTMPFNDFADIVTDHTSSYLRQRTVSMINFAVNSGAYSLAVRHLNYFDKNEDAYFWQHLRARSGIYESIVEILKRGPGFTALIIGSTLAWCFVIFSAAAGLTSFLKDKNIKYFTKALLLSLVAYQVTIVMLFSVGARWQHRSLLDFVIILLAIYGLKKIQLYFKAKRARKISTDSKNVSIAS